MVGLFVGDDMVGWAEFEDWRVPEVDDATCVGDVVEFGDTFCVVSLRRAPAPVEKVPKSPRNAASQQLGVLGPPGAAQQNISANVPLVSGQG